MTGFSLVIILLIFSLLFITYLYFPKSNVIKLVVGTYLIIISSGIYFSFETYKGWPTIERGMSGIMVMSVVVEPTQDFEGAIYIWVLPKEKEVHWLKRIYSYTPSHGATPRVFQIPYSDKAASDFNQANDQIKEGYLIEIDDSGNPAEGGTEGKNQETGNGERGGDQEGYDVPHLKLISPDTINRK